MILNNNITVFFSHEKYCTHVLYEFAKKDLQNNNNIYFNYLTPTKYFIDIQNQKYSKLYSFFIKCIQISTKTLIQQHSFFILKLFSNSYSQWNFCIFNNIMFNCPFTLSNIIFIPLNYLISSYNNNKYIQFSNTLVHEKIHIFQRFNLTKWINIIHLSFKNWILIKYNTPIYNYLVNYDFKKNNIIRVFNPDVTYNFLYLYFIQHKYYYGFFHLNSSNNISILWFQLHTVYNNLTITISNNLNLPNQEHPFEMFAYRFADILL